MVEFRCKKCNEEFTLEKYLRRHVRRVHVEQLLRECGIHKKKTVHERYAEIVDRLDTNIAQFYNGL